MNFTHTLPSLANWRLSYGETARPDPALWLESLSVDPAFAFANLAQQLSWPYLAGEALQAWTPCLNLISFADATQRGVLAVQNAEGELGLIAVNPFVESLLTWADSRIGALVQRWLVDPADFTAYLSRIEDQMRAADTVELGDGERAVEITEEGLTLASIASDDSPNIKLVNSTLYDAWRSEASDIHLESTGHGMRVRYRLDGVLVDVSRIPGAEQAEQVISRIKVLAELDISERRIPQDGRFKMIMRGQSIDFRVSIMPSIHGEDAVLRLLDKGALAQRVDGLTLAGLGFDAKDRETIEGLAREPYGMLLVTGPTGSGKSTSLYAVVESLDRVRDKVITIEDPVEYQLANALQIPVNEKKGLTFARGLRSILRHDPDTILVGEIRDAETAQIAIQAALTGHLVLTSVHANHTFDVIGRLLHMEVDPYNFVSALNGIVAQRLVRLNCPKCSEPYHPDETLLRQSSLGERDLDKAVLLRGKGCSECRFTGYKGRQAVAEILVLDDDLRERILRREPVRVLKELARAKGMRDLRESALARVRAGLTTLEEINRVTFVSPLTEMEHGN
jgi:general secretion pathway protein E